MPAEAAAASPRTRVLNRPVVVGRALAAFGAFARL